MHFRESEGAQSAMDDGPITSKKVGHLRSRIAKELYPDLAVIRTHARSGIERLLIGSPAEVLCSVNAEQYPRIGD